MPNLSEKDLLAIRVIRNSIVHNGRSPTLAELKAVLGYESPYSVQLLLKKLEERGILKRDGKYSRRIKITDDPDHFRINAQTVDVPLVGNAPCGTPFLAEQNIEMTIPVSIGLAKPPHHYFLLRAIGDSMNLKGITDGDLVLVRQQADADSGSIIVALIDGNATIKELRKTPNAIILKPRSDNPEHQPIILTDDFIIQGKVFSTIPNPLG